MIDKPIFWHSRHKEMWNLIATGKATRKSEALRVLDYDAWPNRTCYACECGNKWNSGNPFFGEKCACPLRWGNTSTMPCLYSTDADAARLEATGTYGVWDALVPDDPMFRELAALIRDLPLNPETIDLYEVL